MEMDKKMSEFFKLNYNDCFKNHLVVLSKLMQNESNCVFLAKYITHKYDIIKTNFDYTKDLINAMMGLLEKDILKQIFIFPYEISLNNIIFIKNAKFTFGRTNDEDNLPALLEKGKPIYLRIENDGQLVSVDELYVIKGNENIVSEMIKKRIEIKGKTDDDNNK